MIKRKQNIKPINDQKEKEHKEYQWSKRNRTQRLSMIKRKHNTKTSNDQKETEHKDYQWSKGIRTQRLSMINNYYYRDTEIVLILIVATSEMM